MFPRMNYLIYLVLCSFHLFITIHSDISNTIDKSSQYRTHYTSYHLDWNDATQWSVNDEIPLNLEIIACAIAIPSLCIYAFPPHPGFYLFYKDTMYDFLSDSNWTQIIVTNNYDTESYNQLMQKLIDNPSSTKPVRRRLFHLTPCFTERCRERRRAQKRKRRCGARCKMRAAGTAFHLLHRGLAYLKERKERKRVYNQLYRFGRKMGRAMKSGNFKPLCGLTGGCSQHHRRSGCGGYGSRCPRRYMTYLGRPHVVGRPEYILGSPPLNSAPMGYGGSPHFAMNLGGMMPSMGGMHGGMMGGMHGGMMGGMHPSMGGMNGMMGGMMGGMNGGMMGGMHPSMGGMNGGMMGGMPGSSGWMTGNPMILGPGPYGTMSGLHDTDYAFGGDPYGGPGGLSGAVHSLLHRRRMMDDDEEDIRLKKCVLIGVEEICAMFYYINDGIRVEYNVVLDEEKRRKVGKGMSQYVKGNVWILRNDELDSKQCNDNVLEYIGYTICVQRMNDGIYVDGVWENRMNLMRDEAWNKIYDVNDGNARKLCRYISMIEICFEVSADQKMVQITSERLLSLDEAQ